MLSYSLLQINIIGSFGRYEGLFCNPSFEPEYDNYYEAELACTVNSKCKMFTDNLGTGDYFTLCESLAVKVKSRGGSILYVKGN